MKARQIAFWGGCALAVIGYSVFDKSNVNAEAFGIWYRTGPGYATGRFYPLGTMANITTAAVPTTDTVVFAYPFTVNAALSFNSLNARVLAGVTGCAMKFAIWATGASTKRPTGIPIAASNSAQSCASTNTTPTISISYTLQPGVPYWAASAVTTGTSTFNSCNASQGISGDGVFGQGGKSIVNSTVSCGVTAPYTYANDITALDLTSATFTDVVTSGVPIIYAGN